MFVWVPRGFDYCIGLCLHWRVCVCVCERTRGDSFSILAVSVFSLIGLQRCSGLAGGWPADHDNDPSLPPPQTLQQAPVTCPPLPPLLSVTSPSPYTSASSWEATGTWPPPLLMSVLSFFCFPRFLSSTGLPPPSGWKQKIKDYIGHKQDFLLFLFYIWALYNNIMKCNWAHGVIAFTKSRSLLFHPVMIPSPVINDLGIF